MEQISLGILPILMTQFSKQKIDFKVTIAKVQN